MSVLCNILSKCPPRHAIAMGWYDYNDSATQTTPLSVSSGVRTFIPNDGLGAFSQNDFGIPSITDIYDSSTGAFDFTKLNIGDTVGIRLDLEYDTANPNQTVTQRLDLAIGDAAQYFIKWGSENIYKTAKTHQFSLFNKIYIGNEETRDNPAKFSVLSDGALDVTVNGYYIEVMQRW